MSISFYIVGDADDCYINMSNRNALMVMRFLGVDADYTGEIDAAELAARCELAIATVDEMPELDCEVAMKETRTPLGARVIDCGVPAGYLWQRFVDLRLLAKKYPAARVAWA